MAARPIVVAATNLFVCRCDYVANIGIPIVHIENCFTRFKKKKLLPAAASYNKQFYKYNECE